MRSNYPSVLRETAGALMLMLADNSQQIKDAIIAADALPLLVTLSRSDKPWGAGLNMALQVLEPVACDSLQNRGALTAAGFKISALLT